MTLFELPSSPRLSPSARCLESEQDLVEMQHLLMEGRSRADDWHYPHVNVPAIRLYEPVGFEVVNQYLDYVRSA